MAPSATLARPMRTCSIGMRTAVHGTHLPHRPTQLGGFEPGRRTTIEVSESGFLMLGVDVEDGPWSLSDTIIITIKGEITKTCLCMH